jgi:hypothetical protein
MRGMRINEEINNFHTYHHTVHWRHKYYKFNNNSNNMSSSTTPIPEWKSNGSEKEILAERVKNNRDYLINIRFSKKRKFFGRKLQSSKVDTMDTFRFFPSFKDPRFVEVRKERDFGVQNVVHTTDSSVQTPWYRKVNAASQVSISDYMHTQKTDIDPNDKAILNFLLEVEPLYV